jgi:aldose 1-epimerase
MNIQIESTGNVNGHALSLISLAAGDLDLKVYNIGCSMKELWAPDRAGDRADIILGFASGERYAQPHPYYGALIGRVANRIRGGKFAIDGLTYDVGINEPAIGAHLHGGPSGFHAQVWDFETVAGDDSVSVIFTRTSPDGEGGYPGNLTATYEIRLTNRNELYYIYGATTDKATPFSPTNHNYYNLSGHKSGSVMGHHLQIHANAILHADASCCATGAQLGVRGTAKDFTQPVRLFDRMVENTHEPTLVKYGFDYTYVLNAHAPDAEGLRPAAIVQEPTTGRVMTVLTDQPVVQFFNHCSIDGVAGKQGANYRQFAGLCLETHAHPNFPNHPEFGIAPLQPGETYSAVTKHIFSVD